MGSALQQMGLPFADGRCEEERWMRPTHGHGQTARARHHATHIVTDWGCRPSKTWGWLVVRCQVHWWLCCGVVCVLWARGFRGLGCARLWCHAECSHSCAVAHTLTHFAQSSRLHLVQVFIVAFVVVEIGWLQGQDIVGLFVSSWALKHAFSVV